MAPTYHLGQSFLVFGFGSGISFVMWPGRANEGWTCQYLFDREVE